MELFEKSKFLYAIPRTLENYKGISGDNSHVTGEPFGLSPFWESPLSHPLHLPYTYMHNELNQFIMHL